jgi:lipopolysaccharide transport system permease protein
LPFVISRVIRSAAELTRSLVNSRRLVASFVRRDLRSRYAGSSLGFFWSVIQPLANLAVYMFVFQFVIKARWADTMGKEEVTLVMLTGFVAWGAFAETMIRSTTCMVDNSNLIQKVVFPAEILPTFISISAMVSLLVGLPIIVAAMAFFVEIGSGYADARAAAIADTLAKGKDLAVAIGPPLRWGLPIVMLPVLIALQWLFATGVAYVLCTLNVLVRDMQHVVGLLVMVWMFCTPIFYPAVLLRDTHFRFLLEVNPMFWLIDSYQRIVLYGLWPQWHLLGRFAIVALIVYALGARLLMREKRRFPDFL